MTTIPFDRHSARWLEAQRSRSATILQVFDRAGFEVVAPSYMQPAALMLDLVGEQMREQTYGCVDRSGHELCLRTDMTVPACRLYLQRFPEAREPAKYSYSGTVFRQPTMEGADNLDAGELHQVGLEVFNAGGSIDAEVEVLGLVLKAVRRCDLRDVRVRIGDVAIFHDLVDAIAMPQRWRNKLKHHYWRPRAFMAYLGRLTARTTSSLTNDLRNLLDPSAPAETAAAIASYLEQENIQLLGTRSLLEITAHLLELAADECEPPLALSSAEIIENYFSIQAAPPQALQRIAGLAERQPGLDLSLSISAFKNRLELFAQAGIDAHDMTFAADFGRDFEYYTGFVFEVTAAASDHIVAGGGRYDGLLQAIGAPARVPAVGAAIYTDRLLSAASGNGL